VYQPAVLRAQRLHPHIGMSAALKFHSLRHTYVSLCVAAGITPLEISRFAGHAKVTTTLGITRTCSTPTSTPMPRQP
jgi:integrase